jgi:hypothetical protein
MKYCLIYQPNKERLMSKADELSIIYNRADTTLPDFLEKYREKRIIINIDEDFKESDFKLIKALYEKYSNFVLKLEKYNEKLVKDIKENHIPYFLGKLVND